MPCELQAVVLSDSLDIKIPEDRHQSDSHIETVFAIEPVAFSYSAFAFVNREQKAASMPSLDQIRLLGPVAAAFGFYRVTSDVHISLDLVPAPDLAASLVTPLAADLQVLP